METKLKALVSFSLGFVVGCTFPRLITHAIYISTIGVLLYKLYSN